MKKEKINRKKVKAGIRTFEIVMVVALFFTVTVSSTLIITDTGITTTDSDFVLDFDNNWGFFNNMTIGNATANQGITIDSHDGGIELGNRLHMEDENGVAGSVCFHVGTVPLVNPTGYRMWVDTNGTMWLIQPNANSSIVVTHRIIQADENGSVNITGNLNVTRNATFNERIGIGTTYPKRQFDFDGGDVRTQRYIDSDLNTNLGYETFGGGTLSGEYNNAFGRQSLYSISSGGNNVGLGASTLHGTTTGSNNIGIGYRGGDKVTTGSHNINLGYRTGNAITTGTGNINLGAYTGWGGNYNNSISIGYDVDAPANAGLNIGNLIYGTDLSSGATVSTGNVGIGTTSPSHTLDVDGGTGRFYDSTPATTSVPPLMVGGANANQASINFTNTYADYSIGIGDGWDGYDGDFYIVEDDELAGSNIRLFIEETTGNVGIKRVPATNDLEVEGNVSKTASGDWLANSDRRIKTDIQDIDNGLDIIINLRPVKFKYTDEYKLGHPSIEDKYYYNFIAQEYQAIFPESVKGSGEFLDGVEILQMDSYNAQIVSIKAIQELKAENDALEQRVTQLEILIQRLLEG